MSFLLWFVPTALVIWSWMSARAFDARIQAAVRACGPAATLDQSGQMRMDPEGSWLPFRATQTIGVGRSAFVWDARFRLPWGLSLRVADALGPGGGWLEVRLFGAIPLARVHGRDVTRGQLQRYLAELPWCPRAFAENTGLAVEHVTPERLRVQTAHEEVEGTVELELGEGGDVVGATATRPRTTPSGSVDTPWVGRFAEPADFDGVRLPTYGEVSWVLDSGEFNYWRARITSFRAT